MCLARAILILLMFNSMQAITLKNESCESYFFLESEQKIAYEK